jgi:hypothetical protein
MALIFTAVVGRSGQNTLADYFNKYGIGCFAEVEPPDLIFRAKGPLRSILYKIQIGSILYKIQRRWIVTHELLGRGKAKEWYEIKDHEKLNNMAKKKLRRIRRLQRKYKFKTYIEISKFFMRTQCDYIYDNVPNISLIKLTRDPISNARSFVNRNKNFYLDNVPPNYKQNCLQLDGKRLTKFQLYLWSWFEIELRYYRFIENHKIKKIFELGTKDLNNKEKITEMFEYFGIDHREITELSQKNTNVQQGYPQTIVMENDIREYEEFIRIIPERLFSKVKYLKYYDPYIHI